MYCVSFIDEVLLLITYRLINIRLDDWLLQFIVTISDTMSSSDIRIEGESITIAPSVILHPKVFILSSSSSRLVVDNICLRRILTVVFVAVFQLERDA